MSQHRVELLGEPAAVSLSGSGWNCALAEDEADQLASRLQGQGYWALAYKVDRCRVVSLERNEKRGLLETLRTMQAGGLSLSPALHRLANALDDDLYEPGP